MTTITIGTFYDGEKKWKSFIIDNVTAAMHVIRTIIGSQIIERQLNPHAIGSNDASIGINIDTAKQVYNNMTEGLDKGEKYIMNKNGGYLLYDKRVKWKLLNSKDIKVKYGDQLISHLED